MNLVVLVKACLWLVKLDVVELVEVLVVVVVTVGLVNPAKNEVRRGLS